MAIPKSSAFKAPASLHQVPAGHIALSLEAINLVMIAVKRALHSGGGGDSRPCAARAARAALASTVHRRSVTLRYIQEADRDATV